MSQRIFSVFLFLAFFLCLHAEQETDSQLLPVNQLTVSGNACGPAALLSAFRFGNPDWHRLSSAIPGKNDKENVLWIIQNFGKRPSKNLPGHVRWSRSGVGLADLLDIANEISSRQNLPRLQTEVFILRPSESPEKLLQRTHQCLQNSLAKGFPPVLSLRRYALRPAPEQSPQWSVVDAHFVTLISLPQKLPRDAKSFPITYLDPWGGKHYEGIIAIPEKSFHPNAPGANSSLEAIFPKTSVGKRKISPGAQSFLSPAAAILR